MNSKRIFSFPVFGQTLLAWTRLLIAIPLVAMGVWACGRADGPPHPRENPFLMAAAQALAASSAAADPLAGGAATALVVERREGPLVADPFVDAWAGVPYFEVALNTQQMTMPAQAALQVPQLRVQALHDGTRVAWRLSWLDAEADGNVDAGRFTDAVAVQFPIDPDAAPMMGHKNARVQILHWKALWQKDVDVGFQDVEDLHPNVWSDLYWFTEGERPYRVPGSFKRPESLQWFIALKAGNPMAVISRTQPAEELVAEGWGTLTHQPQSATTARGAWKEGRWTVAFLRPLKTDDPLDAAITPGKPLNVAFAVWQGGAGDVGGRKQWSAWIAAEVKP